MADYLRNHKKVKKVYYPGLPDHPQHALAKKQMNGFGSMISFELGSYDNAKKFLDRVKSLLPRRVARRRGDADLASDLDDARLGP